MAVNHSYDLKNNSVYQNYVNNHQQSLEDQKRRYRNSYMRPILLHNRLQHQKQIDRESHQESQQNHRRNVSLGQQELDYYGRELQELKEKIGKKYYKDYKLEYLM